MWQACFLPAMELHIYKRDYMKWKNVQWYFPLSLVNVYIFWICKVYLNCKKVKTNPKKTCWIWKQTWWDCLTSTAWVLQVHVGPMRSTSVGWLKLKSSDPNDHPIIEPNYLSTGDCSLSLLSCQLFFLSVSAADFCPYSSPVQKCWLVHCHLFLIYKSQLVWKEVIVQSTV